MSFDNDSYFRVHNLAQDNLRKKQRLQKAIAVLCIIVAITGFILTVNPIYEIVGAYDKLQHSIGTTQQMAGYKAHLTREKNEHRIPLCIGLLLLSAGTGGYFYYRKA